MSEAYTKLGIEIEVGKVVTVDTKNVEAKAKEVSNAFTKAFGNQNLFENLAKGISELTVKLGSINFSNLTNGLSAVKRAVGEVDSGLTNIEQSARRLSKFKVEVDTKDALTQVKTLKDAMAGGFELKVNSGGVATQFKELKAAFLKESEDFFNRTAHRGKTLNYLDINASSLKGSRWVEDTLSNGFRSVSGLDDHYLKLQKAAQKAQDAFSNTEAKWAALKNKQGIEAADAKYGDKYTAQATKLEAAYKALNQYGDLLQKQGVPLESFANALQKALGAATNVTQLKALRLEMEKFAAVLQNVHFAPSTLSRTIPTITSVQSMRNQLQAYGPYGGVLQPQHLPIRKYSSVELPNNVPSFLTATNVRPSGDGYTYSQQRAQATSMNDIRGIVAAVREAWKSGYQMVDPSFDNFRKVNGQVKIADADSLAKNGAADSVYNNFNEMRRALINKLKLDAGVLSADQFIGARASNQTAGLAKAAQAVAAIDAGTTNNIEKLVKQFENLDKVKGDKLERASKLITEIGKAAGWSAEETKKILDQLERNAKAESAFKKLDKYGIGATATDIKAQLEQDKINKDAAARQKLIEKRDMELYQLRSQLDRDLETKRKQASDQERKDKTAMYKGLFDEIAANDKAVASRREVMERREIELAKQRGDALKQQQKEWDKQAGNAIGAGIASRWTPEISIAGGKGQPDINKGRATDIVSAEAIARTQQAMNVVEALKRAAQSTKVTATDAAEAFKKAGVNLQDLKDEPANKVAAALKRMGIAADTSANSFKDIQKEVKQTSTWAKLFGESIGKMATRLMEFYSIRTVIFAVGSEFRTAATTLMDFNQALHDTAAIANASPEALKRMEDAAISMAKNTKYSAVEVMEAMKLLAQAGVSESDLPEVTRVATMLATGTGATFDQATKVLTTGMNVWNISGEKSIYVANTLTAALNASKLEIGELGTAFNYLANQNALFGKSIEETTALIAVLRNQGMEASTIGTSMRQFMKTLVAPTPRFTNLLSTYGISKDQIDPTKHSMVEILKVFEKVGEKGIAVQDIFQSLETRVGGGFATLFKAGSAELELMETRIKNSDAALIAYTESMKGFRAQVNVLRQEFVETMNAFVTKSGSETFLSGLTKDVQSLLVGLRGLAKEWNGFKTAGIGAIAAITALWNLTPWGRMITLGVGAATWAIKKQGDQVMGPARAVDTLTKEYADTSAKQARQGTDAADLLKIMKGKDLTAERFTKLSSEEKKRVNEILNANDSIFKGLSAQDLKYGDIQRRVSTLNETHTQSTKTFIANTNEQVRRLQILDKELETKKKMAKSASPMFAEGIQRRIDELEAQRKPLVDSIAQAQSAVAGKTKFTDVGNGLKTGEYDPYSPPAVEVNTDSKIRKKPKGAESEAKKAKNASLSFDLAMEEETVKQSKLKLDEIMQMVKDKSLTSKEIAQKELEVQAELTKLYGADGQSGLIGRAIEAKVDKQVESSGLTGDKAAKLKAAMMTTELAQSKKEQAKYSTEFANYYKKQSDAFNAEVAKIKENAAKVQEANDKRTLELVFKNMEGNAEDRIDAYYTYLFSVYDRNELEFQKAKKALDEKFAADDSWDEAAYNESLDKLKAIKNDSNSKAQTETSSFVMSAMDSQIAKKEKEYDTELRHAQAALALKKQQAWSADEIRQLDIQAAQAEEETLTKKQRVYATELETIEGLKQQKALGDKLSPAQEALVSKASDYKDKLVDINAQLAAQKIKVQEISDTSFSGNFLQGMRNSIQSLGDFASITRDLGKSMTDSFTSGLTSTVSNTFTTLFNPDTQKINELNAKIAELRTQKTTLESDIATIEANTSKTPEEIKTLNEKKVALDNVNNSLKEQEAAVRKQKDAWSTFSEGLKGIMKTILQELQNYIAKMLVVWAVQKLVGLAEDSVIGDMFPSLFGYKEGGTVKGYAEGGTVDGLLGGMVPLNMGQLGKDSVPAILEPGEVIIKKSSVDYYGADKLLALNQGKIAKFAEGGLVGSSSAPSAKSAEDAKSWTLQIVNIAQGDQVPDPGQQATQIINVINNDIARKGPTYKTIKTAVAT